MLWIATAAMLAAAEPTSAEPAGPQRQARAAVRIVRAATIRQNDPKGTQADGAVIRESRPRTAEATSRRVKLVEFY